MINDCAVSRNSISYSNAQIEVDTSPLKAWFDTVEKRFYVLFDYNQKWVSKRFSNLVAISENGKLAWTAVLPTDSDADCFTDAYVENNVLKAFSYSCNYCEICLSTGMLVKKEFTK